MTYCVPLPLDFCTDNSQALRDWLRANIGEPMEDWGIDFKDSTITLTFLSESDRIQFLLTWRY